MNQLVRGIIIRTTRYSDKSFICQMLTDQFGLRSFMVRSGNTPKASKAHLLQPLTVIEFEMHLRENMRIQNLRNIQLSQRFNEIPFNPVKAGISLFISEILWKTLEDGYKNDALFGFLTQTLAVLDHETRVANFPAWFLAELSGFYGFYPQIVQGKGDFFDLKAGMFCSVAPAHSFFLGKETGAEMKKIISHDYSAIREVNIPAGIRKKLLDSLVLYLQLHLDKIRSIESLAVLHEVFH
ncbi:MAG: DNA repair protein RecO [Crocinitomicaceae bacterium]|nr:DNA repair protein RecO [Crocinitomicaceae bacterium]